MMAILAQLIGSMVINVIKQRRGMIRIGNAGIQGMKIRCKHEMIG